MVSWCAGRTMWCLLVAAALHVVVSSPVPSDKDMLFTSVIQVGAADGKCVGWDAAKVGAGCAEGSLIDNGGTCTVKCPTGYVSDVPSLKCIDSIFSPKVFRCQATGCPVPSNIANVNPEKTCEEFYGAGGLIPSGSDCTATCAEGFTPYPTVLSCSKGELSYNGKPTATFACKAIADACKHPAAFPEGVEPVARHTHKACVASDSMDIFESCTVGCKTGFTESGPLGSDTTNCTAISLDVANLVCTANPCPVPGTFGDNIVPATVDGCVANGTLQSGEACNVKCAPGYSPRAQTTTVMSCYAETLTRPTLICDALDCGEVPKLEHAHFGSCNTTFDSEMCETECDIGYEGKSVKYRCNEFAEWSGLAPTCTIKDCKQMPALTHASYAESCHTTTYNSNCTATCDPGYKGDSKTINCDASAQWTGDLPVCTDVICERNNHVESHACKLCVDGKFTEPGHAASGLDTECTVCPIDTFRPHGVAECAKCPQNSTTDGETGQVAVTNCKCKAGTTGTIHFDSSTCFDCAVDTYKSHAGPEACTACPVHADTNDLVGRTTLEDCACSKGYSGNVTSGCTACPENTFKADRGVGACVECPLHSTTDKNIAVGSIGGCICSEGYSGDLNDWPPKCIECPANTYKDTKGTNACVACPTNSHTGNATASTSIFGCVCDEGYTQVNDSNHKSFVCKANQCDINSLLPEKRNAGYAYEGCVGKTTTEQCDVHCNVGYSGDAHQVTCLPSGKFDFTMSCAPNQCKPIEKVNGFNTTDCALKTTTENCTKSCMPGYSGGSVQLTCAPTGLFVGSPLTCSPNTCIDLEPMEGVDLSKCQGKVTDESCQVKCAEGYYVPAEKGSSTQTFTCMPNGRLGGNLPPCEVSFCAAPKPIEGVDFSPLTSHPVHIFDSVIVRCQPGYEQTESKADYMIKPFNFDGYTVQYKDDKGMWLVKTTGFKYTVRPGLDGTKGTVSLSSLAMPDSFVRVSSSLLFFDKYNPAAAGIFNTSATFYLKPAANGAKNAYSLSPVDNPSKFVVHENFKLKVLTVSADSDPLLRDSASFLFDPPLQALPSTVESNYTCMPGGTYSTSVAPACTRAFCKPPTPIRGVNFAACASKQTGDRCNVPCSEGYTPAADSGTAVFECGVDGQFDGTAPVCEPALCSTPQWPASIIATECAGKRTNERCFVGCREGYSASARLLSGMDTTEDTNYAPLAAVSEGCRNCGSGSYAGYPCDDADAAISCTNWCRETKGCKYVRVHTAGEHKGKCCLLTEMPGKQTLTSPNANIAFYSMDADFFVVDAKNIRVKNIDQLKQVCGDYSGLSLVSVRNAKKLAKVYELVKRQSFVNLELPSGIPLAYSPQGNKQFFDFNDGFTPVHSLLSAAANDQNSYFTGSREWESDQLHGHLVGFGNGEDKFHAFDFDAVQAVVCERSFECAPSGRIVGEVPACIANQCAQPEHSGTDFSQCAGKRVGESCDISCRANHESLDVVYEYALAIGGSLRQHSVVPRLPTGGPLNLGFSARVSSDAATWDEASLLVLGGSTTSCCDGSLTIFTQANAGAKCNAPGKFAFGVGMTCNSTGAPLLTDCVFEAHHEYEVHLHYEDGVARLFIDGVERASGARSLAIKPSSEDGGLALTFLNGCHSEEVSELPGLVQYIKIWAARSKSRLTCGANGFEGTNPCVTTCAVPQTPLNINFTNCDGITAGRSCAVSCFAGSPTVDVAFQTDSVVDRTAQLQSYMQHMPTGGVLTINFAGRVSGESTAYLDFITLGGSATECCGGSWVVYAASKDVAGCVPGSGRFAIGFGPQCATDANPHVLTSCEFSKETYYDIRVEYASGVAKIIVDGEQKASREVAYRLQRTGPQGYGITFLGGCHNMDHEVMDGEVVSLRIYSVVKSFPLQCEHDGSFSGALPSCLDNICMPPKHVSGVNTVDCFNKRIGESCTTKCSPGYSEDGIGQDDVREDALLWLEATDLKNDEHGKLVWADHRGESFSEAFTVYPHNVHLDTRQRGIRFSADDDDASWVKIFNLDISPEAMSEVTLEAWVKLDSVANRRGWLVGNDRGSFGRHLMLHDGRFGAEGTTAMAMGVGETYTSGLGAVPVGAWVHVVGTWRQGGAAFMYRNGIPDFVSENVHSLAGDDFLVIGGHAHAAHHGFNGIVSSVRIYPRALSKEEVVSLYLKGRSADLAPAATKLAASNDVRQSSLLWLDASDVSNGTWPDHRGAGFARYTVSADRATFDSNANGVRFDASVPLAKIAGLDLSPRALPEVTIEVWAKLANVSESGSAWIIGHDNGAYDRSIIAYDPAFGGASAIGVGHAYTSKMGAPVADTWLHFVGVWGSSRASIYKNGVLYRTEPVTLTGSGSPDVFIGGHPTATGHAMNGWVHSVRVYGRQLLGSEIESLYTRSHPLGTAPNAESIVSAAQLYLEARDISNGEWVDHRGNVQKAYKVEVEATVDPVHKALRLQNEHTRATVKGLDIRPDTAPAVTVECWVKLHSVANNRGILLGNNARSIVLHDARYGAGNGVLSSGLTVAAPYASHLGYPKLGEWIHVVAVWQEGRTSSFYRDGVAERVPGITKSAAGGLEDLVLGDATGIDGWLSTVRVYGRALNDAEVLALFKHGHYAASINDQEQQLEYTAQACEDKALQLQCVAGKTIHIKDAAYGRSDSKTCPGVGTSVVDCRAPLSLANVARLCEGHADCTVQAANQVFGDPCHGTTKYLTVDFECVDGEAATNNAADVRHRSIMWLEASDVAFVNGEAHLGDHRGHMFGSEFAVRFADVEFDAETGLILLNKPSSHVSVNGLNLNPSVRPEVSVEMWVKASAMTNNRGWLMSTNTDADAPTRSIMAHDDRFGVNATALGCGEWYRSQTGPFHTDEWVHIVGVWSQLGQAVLYKNGLADTASFSAEAAEGMASVIFGNHPTQQKGFQGAISAIRVYSTALSASHVLALYHTGRHAANWLQPRAISVSQQTCSGDNEFHGRAPVCIANLCSAPTPVTGVDFSQCAGKRTGESCAVACSPGFTGAVTTFAKTRIQCDDYTNFDKLVGRVTMQECKAACAAGVRGCKHNCATPDAAPTRKICNALGFNSKTGECRIYQGCQGLTRTDMDFDYYLATTSGSASLTCGINARFAGPVPNCVPEEETNIVRATYLNGNTVVCEGNPINMACANGKVLRVKQANYGYLALGAAGPACRALVNQTQPQSDTPVCKASGVLDHVKTKCDGKSACLVKAENSELGGDPCVGLVKTLAVDYECVAPAVLATPTKRVCESATMNLACSGTKVISVKQTMFGRLALDPCPVGDRSNLKCSAADALTKVKGMCDGRSTCNLDAVPETFGADPCPGITKYLDVEYDCVDVPQTVVCQGDNTTLTCPGDQVLQIKEAFYGRKEGHICPAESSGNTNCDSTKAFALIAMACNERSSCLIDASSSFFKSDPCPDTSKYVQVNHECVTRKPAARVCEDATVHLGCSVGNLIHIESAMFGRQRRDVCPSSSNKNTSCSAADALAVVTRQCEGKASCSIQASTKTFGDPCAETTKYLDINYSCREIVSASL